GRSGRHSSRRGKAGRSWSSLRGRELGQGLGDDGRIGKVRSVLHALELDEGLDDAGLAGGEGGHRALVARERPQLAHDLAAGARVAEAREGGAGLPSEGLLREPAEAEGAPLEIG